MIRFRRASNLLRSRLLRKLLRLGNSSRQQVRSLLRRQQKNRSQRSQQNGCEVQVPQLEWFNTQVR
jgi:hypothetical protein